MPDDDQNEPALTPELLLREVKDHFSSTPAQQVVADIQKLLPPEKAVTEDDLERTGRHVKPHSR